MASRITRVWSVAALMVVACGASSKTSAPAAWPTPIGASEARASWSAAQSVFESRCVVCHGCYDAPCQLKLGTYEGIARGASIEKVYESTRLTAATPTRLGIDAHDAASWRTKGFHAVIPETDANTNLITRMLDLKRAHPITESAEIAKDFTLDLNRAQTCSTADHFGDFAKNHPLWGMPYGLPGLDTREEAAIVDWIHAGAPHIEAPALPPAIVAEIDHWEMFFNESPYKSQLAARYIYEHLFLASIYFVEIDDHTFFRLVRSRTPSGTAVDEIPTRRPFDDPNVPRVYYRFIRQVERPLEKTHMPYPLSAARLKHYRALFIDAPYTVEKLPTYDAKTAANPFRAFAAIPAPSRYRFMLDEAEFTMMGFIKGPVCRGQVALNVIEDRFWVNFLSPDVPWMNDETAFLAGVEGDLDMPAEGGSAPLPTLWLRYANEHDKYVQKRTSFLENVTRHGDKLDMRMIWNGDGHDSNAALTVFRHFDSASVVKGFVGRPTKTSWIIGYPLLERIHYLLVAGFDVFGNVAHQVSTRLYMDFLRMEGEANYLMFLPPSARGELVDHWYRGVSAQAKAHITRELTGFRGAPNIDYHTRDPRTELDAMLAARVAPLVSSGFELALVDDGTMRASLEKLDRVAGTSASWMPEISFVRIGEHHFTILRDSGHTNVDELFNEDDRRLRSEDALVVVRGFLGAYPNALFDVERSSLESFVTAIATLDGATYHALRERYGVLRSSERFWPYADEVTKAHARDVPIQPGMFDFNRLEAF